VGGGGADQLVCKSSAPFSSVAHYKNGKITTGRCQRPPRIRPWSQRQRPAPGHSAVYKTTCKIGKLVTFQVVTAASMKITAFWDIAPYCLVVQVDRRYGGENRLHHQGDSRDYTALYIERRCRAAHRLLP
jgi:hypothetical protein